MVIPKVKAQMPRSAALGILKRRIRLISPSEAAAAASSSAGSFTAVINASGSSDQRHHRDRPVCRHVQARIVTCPDQAAEHDAKAPEPVAAAHDHQLRRLLCTIGLDVEAELKRRQRHAEKHQRHEKHLMLSAKHRQRHNRQKRHEAIDDGRTPTDPSTRAARQTASVIKDADRHAKQHDGEIGRPDARAFA
jgi:hypothetical protein